MGAEVAADAAGDEKEGKGETKEGDHALLLNHRSLVQALNDDMHAALAPMQSAAVASGHMNVGGPLVASARNALARGAPILCDSEMVAHGLSRARLPAQNAVTCRLRDAAVPALAAKLGTTRSAAAVELWAEQLEGSVVAIGNAPTALFHFLELLERGAPQPAAVVGIPVGFVGAAESKQALAANPLAVPYLTVRGRIGGSAMTAAAINALARPGL